jgi:hypothetical protein
MEEKCLGFETEAVACVRICGNVLGPLCCETYAILIINRVVLAEKLMTYGVILTCNNV